MKKQTCWFSVGILLSNIFIAAAVPINKQQVISEISEKTVNELPTTLLYFNVTVEPDGTLAIVMDYGPDNWTGNIQNASFIYTIRNPHNYTGSFSFKWRLAEYPVEGFLGWLFFWIMHGNIRPSNQPNFLGTSTELVQWSPDDPDVKVIEHIFGLKINQAVSFEIVL